MTEHERNIANVVAVRKWRKANPAKVKLWNRKSNERHNAKRDGRKPMTAAEYGVLLGKQEGLCAICSVVLDRGKRTHVDHDHTTGKTRALLCGNCNNGLGHFKESSEALRLAANYIEFHQRSA